MGKALAASLQLVVEQLGKIFLCPYLLAFRRKNPEDRLDTREWSI
jgi:hypothetical protein